MSFLVVDLRGKGAHVLDAEPIPIFCLTFRQIPYDIKDKWTDWKGEDRCVPLDPPLYMVLNELYLKHSNNEANWHHAKDSKSICVLWP